MNKNKKGFTLIELLVVVLIIGILAAVAVPQYLKSVERSRAAEAFITIGAINSSVQRLFLENGYTYPANGACSNLFSTIIRNLGGGDVTTENPKLEYLDIEVPARSKYFLYFPCAYHEGGATVAKRIGSSSDAWNKPDYSLLIINGQQTCADGGVRPRRQLQKTAWV